MAHKKKAHSSSLKKDMSKHIKDEKMMDKKIVKEDKSMMKKMSKGKC